jgi:4-hydroxy-2-oxoheptanedioate aldolase
VLFVGPWDLGNNIGRPVEGAFHDDLNTAIERIRKAVIESRKRVGIYCPGGEAARKYSEQGFHMVNYHLSLFLRQVVPAFAVDA